jgi:D-inositol-3-phosphate glycosyltransferase
VTMRVGSCVHSASIVDEAPLYGRNVAVEMFYGALARHGLGYHRLFYAHPGARAFLERLQSGPGVTIDIAHIDELFDDFDAFPFDSWHDADADLASATRMRATFSRRLFPITATAHVLSYQGLLQGWITDTLLADVRPCDALICISRSAKTAIANLLRHVGERLRAAHGGRFPFRGELVVLPYSIDTERFRPRPRASDRFVLLWIGRLSKIDKGDLVPLLRVFRNLVRGFPERDLVLAIGGSGSPEYEQELRDAAREFGVADRVEFRGAIDPAERHLLFNEADVFVSPVDNLQETLGNTPLEALASGVPQVVADWDGYRDMVVDGDTGFLIPTYWAPVDAEENRRAGLYDNDAMGDHFRLAQSVALDLGAMERALASLIRNEPLRRAMGAASRAHALATFAEPVIMRRFDEVWTHLDAVARKLPFTPCAGYATPAFFANFSHYASEVIGEGTRFIATGEETPPMDPRLRLVPGTLRHTMWLLKHGIVRRAGAPASRAGWPGGVPRRRR